MSRSDSSAAGASGSDSKSIREKILDYCLKNPFLVLWNAALILGGLITFSHFTRIGYFPDLDVKAVSSFLLGIALLGLVLILVLGLVLVAPSYLVRNDIWKTHYLFSPALAGQERSQVSEETEKQRRGPFLILNLCYGLIAFSFWIFFSTFFISEAHGPYRYIVRIISFIAFFLLILTLSWLIYSWKIRGELVSDGRVGHGHVIQHVKFGIIWFSLIASNLLLIFLSAARLKEEDAFGHVIVVLFVIALIIINSYLSTKNFASEKSYWVVPAMGALLITVYLIIPSNPFSITRAVFSSLAIGDIGNIQFVVKRPTCDAVNLIASEACEVASETMGCIRPERMDNRVGGEYLLIFKVRDRFIEKSESKKDLSLKSLEVRVPIPKSEVLTWGSANTGSVDWKACGKP